MIVKSLVTVFYPTSIHVDNIKKLSEQCSTIFICDNTPGRNNSNLFIGIDNVTYIANMENLGLSLAFNKILRDSTSFDDDDFVIFFDQDSRVSPNHISMLLDEYLKLKAIDKKIGCIGPEYFNESSGLVEKPKHRIEITSDSYQVATIITSSMLCEYRTLKKIDFWNNNVFLDMADWDLCWRMNASGYSCYMTQKVTLNHTLGKGEKKFLFLRIMDGAPSREYYQTRECLYLRKEKYVPLKFKIRFFLMLTVRPLLHLIFLSEKKLRLFYIMRGIKDYKKCIHGVLND